MTNYIRETAHGISSVRAEDILFCNREIFLTADVNTENSVDLIKQLMVLEKLDQDAEVTLYINSPGGDVMSGLAVYDYISLMKTPVRTVCIGLAASMGAMIFLAGDKREMLPHTQLMIHDPAYGGGDMAHKKPHELQSFVDKLRQTQEIIVKIIAERTGRSLEEVYEKTRTDSYFNAEEAIEYGLATGLVEETNQDFPDF